MDLSIATITTENEAERIYDLLTALNLLRSKGIITEDEHENYAMNVLAGEG